MVAYTHWRNLGPVEQLEDVHGDEHLSHDDEYIALGNDRGASKRGMEVGTSKGNVDEGICGNYEDQNLGGTSNVMVDETPPGGVVHAGVDFPIDLSQQEAFEDVEAYAEVNDEDNADDEGAEGCKNGDCFERDTQDVGTGSQLASKGSFVELLGEESGGHD